MNRIENYAELETSIVTWIRNYVNENKLKSLVVGVSGGIDSAVVATLCAETGIPTYVLSMPLKSSAKNDTLSDSYTTYLENNYDNVTKIRIDLGSSTRHSSQLLIFGQVKKNTLVVVLRMQTPSLVCVW